MLAGAASFCALPCPLVSRQGRLRTLVFPGKTCGFAVDGVGFELVVRCFELRVWCDMAEAAGRPFEKLLRLWVSDIVKVHSAADSSVGQLDVSVGIAQERFFVRRHRALSCGPYTMNDSNQTQAF